MSTKFTLTLYTSFASAQSGNSDQSRTFSSLLYNNKINFKYHFTLLFFVWFDSLRPINNLSVIKGRVFLGWTSTKLGLMFLLKDTTQWRRWGSNPRPFGLESSTLPLHSTSLYCLNKVEGGVANDTFHSEPSTRESIVDKRKLVITDTKTGDLHLPLYQLKIDMSDPLYGGNNLIWV